MGVRTLTEEEFYGRGVGKYLYYKAYYPPNPAHDTLITYRINVDSSDSRIKGYEWGNIIHVSVSGYSINKAWDCFELWEFTLDENTRKLPEFKRWPNPVADAIIEGVRLNLQMPHINLPNLTEFNIR